MARPNEPPWEIIAAFVAGEALAQPQHDRLNKWLQTDPDAVLTLQQARRSYAAKVPLNPLTAWNRVHQSIQFTNLPNINDQ